MMKLLRELRENKLDSTKVTSKMGKNMEKGTLSGIWGNNTQANGKKEKNMEMVIGDRSKEIHIWVTGDKEKQQDSEYIAKFQDQSIKASLLILSSMEKESKSFQMETFSKDSTTMVIQMEEENIHGKMGQFLKEYLKTEITQEMDF